MRLNKNNKKLEELKKKIEELPKKDLHFLARLIYKIMKFKSGKTRKVMLYSIIICSLGITLKLFGNTDVLNNWIKINDKNIVSSVYPKNSYLNNTSKFIYKDFESIEKDFDIEFFKPNNLFTDFDLDVIEVSFDGTKNRIRINALYTNLSNYNMTYNVYIGKSISTNSKSIKEKKDIEAKEFYCNGIKFLSFQNNHWYSISWYYQDVEYEIHGFRNEQEILNTIKNINIKKRGES